MKYTKVVSIIAVGTIYFVAIIIAYHSTFLIVSDSLLLKAVVADLVGTTIVFFFSFILNNSSVYDPYWSVAPVFLTFYWMIEMGSMDTIMSSNIILLLLGVTIWSIRLTYNWISGWAGLQHEDWRYISMRNKTGKFYWPVSFLGIHLFPTVAVFLGCLPVYFIIKSPHPIEWTGLVVFALLLGAVAYEGLADKEMRHHRGLNRQKNAVGNNLEKGLWAWSRHPNYFGEIIFWVSIYLFHLIQGGAPFWTVAGVLTMIFLFNMISIPMMEKRLLKQKTGYKNYRKHVSKIIPLPPGSWGERK